MNSYAIFGGATRRRFFAINEKPEGGGSPPFGRARVICICILYLYFNRQQAHNPMIDGVVKDKTWSPLNRGSSLRCAVVGDVAFWPFLGH